MSLSEAIKNTRQMALLSQEDFAKELHVSVGSTTGGLVLYCACSMHRQPACMLFSEPIDSLAAAGAVLADV